MNEESHAKRKREAELGQLTSAALSDLLTAAGWELTGLHRKQDRVQALLHLEGYAVQEEILGPLGMRPLEPLAG